MGRPVGAEEFKRKTRAEREAQETVNERMSRLTRELQEKEIIPKLVTKVRDNIDKNGPYDFSDTSFLSAYAMGLNAGSAATAAHFFAGTIGFTPGAGFGHNDHEYDSE